MANKNRKNSHALVLGVLQGQLHLQEKVVDLTILGDGVHLEAAVTYRYIKQVFIKERPKCFIH